MTNESYLSINDGINIQLVNADTNEIISTLNNQTGLTNINKEIRQKMLVGDSDFEKNELKIKYFAMGTGTKEFDPTDTELENEIFRKYITNQTVSDNIVTTTCSLGAEECNERITEIGVFSETGTLISRFLVDYTKTSNIILNIIRYDITII